MKCKLLLLLSLLTASVSYAQHKIKLQGVAKDSTNLQKIHYLTVSLFKDDTPKTLIANTLTDTAGTFTFTVDTGKYVLAFNSFGYQQLTQKLVISTQTKSDLGIYLMKPQASQLREVVISGTKPLIKQDRDRLIYDVEQDPSAKSESVSEIFRKVPMLSVDGDGNVQMNGQSNFKVLLNGRETALFAQNIKDALKGFPGAIISKIEVITSPSAKYDAEGIGGIINIITKKAIFGYNGFVSVYYSNINYNASTNFSVRSGKLGITGTYYLSGIYDNKTKITSETLPLVPSVYQSRMLTGERTNDRFYNDGNIEISYNVDSLQTLVLYGNISGGNGKNNFVQHINTRLNSSTNIKGLFDQQIKSNFPNYGLGTEFIKKYKSNKEKELSIRFNGQFSKNDELNESSLLSVPSNLFLDNQSYSNNKEYTLQTDFLQPLSNNFKLETGAKVIFRKAESNYSSLSKTDESLPFEPNPLNTDSFGYNQQVYSGYASLNFYVKQINFRTGLRVEHTTVNGDFFSSDTKVKQDYTSLIPDLSMNAKLAKNYTIVLSYTKRLQRPYINTLNPFVNNNDPLNISFGNPDLSAQTIHTISLQNRLVNGSNFASLSFNASYSGNMIVQYANFNEKTGITAITYGNLGKNVEAGSSLVLNGSLSKKVNGGIVLSLRYNKIENKFIATQHAAGFSGLAVGFFAYKITELFTLSGSGGISKQTYNLVNSASSNPFYQINFGYKFFNQKLSTTINFNNFFNKWQNVTALTKDANFTTKTINTSLSRVIYAGFTYNFGKLKENLSKKKGVKNDDLIN